TAVQDQHLRIAEVPQQDVAAARLAEAGVHRLLVDDRGFRAGKAGVAERLGEFVRERLEAFRGGCREVGENVVDVDRARQVAGRVGGGIAGVDENDVSGLQQVGK